MTPWPLRVAARVLPREARSEILSELLVKYRAIEARRGHAAARRWAWRQPLAAVHARLRWGGSGAVDSRRERLSGALDRLGIDVRHAWRGLVRAPSFSITAWLTLTLSVGLSTAVLSLASAVLVDPLPYPAADRLVRLSEQRATGMMRDDTGEVSDVGLGAWQSQSSMLESQAPYMTFQMVVALPSTREHTRVADVGRDFFTVVATTPVAGRVLVPSDLEGTAAPVAVISDRLARRTFGTARAAVGQPVGLDLSTYTIVGVLPDAYRFPDADTDVWRPGRQFRRLPAPGEQRNMGFRASVVARLRDGVSVADADANGRAVAAALAAATQDAGNTIEAKFHVRPLLDEMVKPIRTALVVLSAGVVLVLAAACISLAHLILARGTVRQREIAVRLAIGAGRWRVGRPAALECLMLLAAGGAGGGLVAWWVLGALPAVVPHDMPRLDSLHFDWRTLAIGLAAAGVSMVGAGSLPVWRLASTSRGALSGLGARVRAGGAGVGERLRGVLAASQVALAAALIVAALLVGRSLMALLNVGLGYDPNGVLSFQAAQTLTTSREPGRLTAYYHALLDRLSTGPSVISVGQASVLPMHSVVLMSGVHVVGRPAEPIASPEDFVLQQYVSTDYFRTVGTRVLIGRGFTHADTASSERVMLVDEVLARRYFPAGDAIGHQLQHGVWVGTIVGVVEAVHYGGPGDAPRGVIYSSTEQSAEFLAFANTGVAVRTAGDPAALIPFVRQVAHEIDPTVPLYDVRPLAEDLGQQVARPRFFAIVIGLFAALALSAALLGLYGVLAYLVERRRLEFGIRRALGASERHVIAIVARGAVRLAGAGLAAGLVGAAIGARSLRALLFGVTPADPASFAAAGVVVVLVVAAASWRPTRQALGVDPARALRNE